ncbi:hypothetical protein GOP47_0001376 [Adiantum capillus-veneris]|uniref:Uncharacterized protein n=1 Tax=Adiantum capillus-veneris TaxID=13818 RepID=A0A9D4V9K5_ADICA|nr:hypothetical protein GOP47_0001376 [Adiantum capillus-veneris]
MNICSVLSWTKTAWMLLKTALKTFPTFWARGNLDPVLVLGCLGKPYAIRLEQLRRSRIHLCNILAKLGVSPGEVVVAEKDNIVPKMIRKCQSACEKHELKHPMNHMERASIGWCGSTSPGALWNPSSMAMSQRSHLKRHCPSVRAGGSVNAAMKGFGSDSDASFATIVSSWLP